jgi:hypothetical protein
MIEPVHPRQRREFHGLERPPRPLPTNHLRFDEPDEGFRKGLIVAVAATADRRLNPGIREPFGVPHREVLAPAVAVMHEVAHRVVTAGVDRLFEGVQHKVGAQRRRHAPADDASPEDVDHEGHVDETLPRRDVRESRHPELIRPRRDEVPIDQVGRARGRGVGLRRGGPRPSPDDADQAEVAHQPTDATARCAEAFPAHLLPDLPGAVGLVVSRQMRWMIAFSTSSRTARVERFVGSACAAFHRK